RGKVLDRGRSVPGLLEQLPGSAAWGVLAFDVEDAGGDLQQVPADGLPLLPDHDDLPHASHGDHRARPGMTNDLPFAVRPGFHLDPDQPPVEDLARGLWLHRPGPAALSGDGDGLGENAAPSGQRRTHEVPEQWVWPGRTGLELGMELPGDEVGMAG